MCLGGKKTPNPKTFMKHLPMLVPASQGLTLSIHLHLDSAPAVVAVLGSESAQAGRTGTQVPPFCQRLHPHPPPGKEGMETLQEGASGARGGHDKEPSFALLSARVRKEKGSGAWLGSATKQGASAPDLHSISASPSPPAGKSSQDTG